MFLQEIVEGPLLYSAFLMFFGCLLLRAIVSGWSILKNASKQKVKLRFTICIFAKVYLPGHRIVSKAPFYTCARYAFHICLIVVPVWFAGHVMLWEESVVQIGYGSITYDWSNRLSLLILFALLIFFLRRILFKEVRHESTRNDYLLLLVTLLPYLTGYLLANNTIDNIARQLGVSDTGDTLWVLHVLSGEIMLAVTALLFVRTRINPGKCLACAACVESCPTNALRSDDTTASQERFLKYSHYQCIRCGNCMRTCPEDAIKLRHEISFAHLLRCVRKRIIHSENLCACEICGSYFIPHAQYIKIQNVISTSTLGICPSCKRRQMIEPIYRC